MGTRMTVTERVRGGLSLWVVGMLDRYEDDYHDKYDARAEEYGDREEGRRICSVVARH